MHKILFLALASTLLFIPAHAQELSHTWGILTQSEKELKTYDLDPEAEAIILFDIGNAHFAETNYGLQIHFERIKRMKILKNGGLKYADIEIPYYTNGSGKTEKVLDIKAIAYNEETGQWVKSELDKKSIFDNKKSKNWREKKFAIPHVKKGTIIEYTYTLETPFMYNLPKWYFQDRIPTLFSNYTVRMVPFYQYTAIGQGLVQGDIIKKEESISERSYAEVKFKELIYSFGKKDVPAFKDESYITSINDYVMKLDFQLSQIHYPKGGSEEILTTWPKLVADLNERENFGEYIHKSNKFVKEILANEVDLSGMTALKKVEKLINYVKSTYRWDGNTGHVARKSPKEFVKQQTGNVSDINLFLIALLRGAGIKATPIIASTRDHGKVKTGYPFEHYFNYTLILVETGNKSFLTDGTATRLNYNLIPTRCINHLGLLVDEKEGEWINLVSKGYSLNRKIIRTEIDLERKVAKTSLSMQCTDFEAYTYKRRFKDDTTQLASVFEGKGFESIESVKTGNYNKARAPYIMQVEGKTEVGLIGENLVLKPLLGFAPQKNELNQDERNYPVDFIYEKADEFQVAIGIPEKYQIAELPEAYKVDNDLVEISIEYKGEEKFVEVNAKYVFKKAVYQPEEYKELKSSIDTIITLFNREIVMAKM